jgi:hypothetical protein
MFFRRNDLTVRSTFRGLTLSVPDHDRLLNACEESQRRRLQRYLGPASAATSWELQWQKMPGDALTADEVVATLHRDGVVVELAYAYRGVLAEWQVVRGEQVTSGTRLATLERRAKAASARASSANAVLKQYVDRQRRDAETIAKLQLELVALQARLVRGATSSDDVKFRRLKTEFSKRFHPDAQPAGGAERERRTKVFQEFWPILEEIERS